MADSGFLKSSMSDLLRKDKKTEETNVPEVVNDPSNKHLSTSSLLKNTKVIFLP